MRHVILPALLATACGAEMTESLEGLPTPGIQSHTAAVTVRDPVVAISPHGRLFRAAISDKEQWPVFILDDDTLLKFPVPADIDRRDESVRHLSLVASGNDQLHAAWSDHQGLYYARFDYSARTPIPRGEAIRIAQGSNTRPMLAVDAAGKVTIAFANGFYSRAPTFQMMITQGNIRDGFSEPEHVNPACCYGDENWTGIDGAWSTSVAALQLDSAGKVHLVYSWDGTLDYVTNKSGRWEHLSRWDDSSLESPDASLALEPEDFHLAYVARDNRSVKYVRYTRAPVVQAITVPEGISQMRMDLDSGKTAHFAIETLENKLLYSTNLMDAPIPMMDTRGDLTRLSKGTGGSLIGPDNGEHVVVFRRGGEPYGEGAVEVVVRPKLP